MIETIIVFGGIFVAGVLFIALIRASNIIRYISNDQLGVVEKLWGARSLKQGFIALNGEVGYQPDILRGGIHVFKPFQYRIHRSDPITVGQGTIAYVFARSGVPLSSGQVLAENLPGTSDFTDARGFLTSGGQQGPQRLILREGIHFINPIQFAVITKDRVFGMAISKEEQVVLDAMRTTIAQRQGFNPVVIAAGEDVIGVVTVHDGPALASGEIIAPDVGADHNNFQEPGKFLQAGGMRGRQLQVMTEGTWYVNRLFATVELVGKTVIPLGTVGVVVSFTGPRAPDVSGAGYRHGELVPNGSRGVWQTPLLPGKYAFNTYAGSISPVPTVNFILKWMMGVSGSAAKLDESLSEISLITKDAFEPLLPLSVVMHINYTQAPFIIQRFGDIKKLVEQTLDPMVSAYFKNIGQTMTLIELIQKRAEIQDRASIEMKAKFAEYSLELQEVLIGTPRAAAGDTTIENILLQLRARQVAREQVETYQEQGKAAIEEKELNAVRATAAMQTALTQSNIKIAVETNEGAAQLARAEKDALTVKVTAEAAGEKARLEGRGEADRTLAIGTASAEATRLAVEAYGGPEYRLNEQNFARFAEALPKIQNAIVPQFQIDGGGDAAGGMLMGLFSKFFAEKMPGTKSDLAPDHK